MGSLWAMGKMGVGKLGIQENEGRHVNVLLGLGEINRENMSCTVGGPLRPL